MCGCGEQCQLPVSRDSGFSGAKRDLHIVYCPEGDYLEAPLGSHIFDWAAHTLVGKPSVRTTSRRNVAFLFCDSASVTVMSGRSSWMGSPGNPAPEPKSNSVVHGPMCLAAKRLSPKCL